MDHFIDAEKVSADYETVQLTKIVIKLTLKILYWIVSVNSF